MSEFTDKMKELGFESLVMAYNVEKAEGGCQVRSCIDTIAFGVYKLCIDLNDSEKAELISHAAMGAAARIKGEEIDGEIAEMFDKLDLN